VEAELSAAAAEESADSALADFFERELFLVVPVEAELFAAAAEESADSAFLDLDLDFDLEALVAEESALLVSEDFEESAVASDFLDLDFDLDFAFGFAVLESV
ncbi:MAG: hypothetical protein JST77_06555, partial [Acidobacteria bacterium]|nr:hypothetical protein [Acidobacteriota bacterium]